MSERKELEGIERDNKKKKNKYEASQTMNVEDKTKVNLTINPTMRFNQAEYYHFVLRSGLIKQ